MAPAHDPPNRLLQGEIMCRWGELTTADILECSNDRSKLVDVLQTRYGYAKLRAEKEVQLFFEEFRDRLRLST